MQIMMQRGGEGSYAYSLKNGRDFMPFYVKSFFAAVIQPFCNELIALSHARRCDFLGKLMGHKFFGTIMLYS
jgi:hypothetical protein